MLSHCIKLDTYSSILVEYRDTVYNVRCTCLPEMKKDTLYKIDISLDGSGDIVRASCACPAGAGHFGSCKNILCALCYTLEQFCRINQRISSSRVVHVTASAVE